MAYTTIDNPELYFQTKLYTGNGGTQSITLDGSEDMQPDWVWIKNRSSAYSHTVFDVIRGTTKRLMTNETAAEETDANTLTAFGSDGFSLGTNVALNQSSTAHVAWNWKGGGSASSNTDGSTTSTVSANTTAGFSIVSYSGTGSNATVGHGLSSAPNVVIIKKRSISSQWCFGTSALGFTKFLELNLTSAAGTNSNRFNDTAPTSSVFSVGTEGDVNTSGTYIAYCFAEKKGYSKFGSYTGNGNADGTFVYTGFKPAWVIIKRTDSADSWLMIDNKRVGYNGGNNVLEADANSAEDSGVADRQDILSNGFKLRSDWTKINASGGTYIYMAFAESPFVNSNGIPNNAR